MRFYNAVILFVSTMSFSLGFAQVKKPTVKPAVPPTSSAECPGTWASSSQKGTVQTPFEKNSKVSLIMNVTNIRYRFEKDYPEFCVHVKLAAGQEIVWDKDVLLNYPGTFHKELGDIKLSNTVNFEESAITLTITPYLGNDEKIMAELMASTRFYKGASIQTKTTRIPF